MNMFNLFHQGSKVNLALMDFLVSQEVLERMGHQVQKDYQQMEQDCQDLPALRVHGDVKENLATV